MNRFRRLRTSPTIRRLVRETILTADDLIQPYFIVEGKNKKQAIASMPGIERLSTDLLLKGLEKFIKSGGQAGLFFGIPTEKDDQASQAYAGNGVVQKGIKSIKRNFPEFLVITDVCLCSYMKHGHCGVMEQGHVHNDKTLELLTKTAVSHAQAGADMVAPSDMMDFRVKAIREGLDQAGLINTSILSYAVKYASSFYGPFRDAADSAPQFGDRKSYQMDYANQREALKEAQQDVVEGADMVMVKPALAYLDIISLLRQKLSVPVVAYSVSGEYSMIKAAAQKGWINEQEVVWESLVAMKRAGADMIITYHAKDVVGIRS
jgi:porphobilinogen synthase